MASHIQCHITAAMSKIFTMWRYASTVYAIGMCLSVKSQCSTEMPKR